MNILKRANTLQSKDYTRIDDNNFILGKDETLDPKFTKIFGKRYAVNVYYLRTNSPELNLENDCININLPMSLRKNNNQNLLHIILNKMYTTIAENEIEQVMEKARHVFGYAPEDYEIRKTPGTLASCDKDTQSITINPQLMMFPKEIIEYVVFHEFCHLKYKNHTQSFYNMLKDYKPNYENLSKQLPNLKY